MPTIIEATARPSNPPTGSHAGAVRGARLLDCQSGRVENIVSALRPRKISAQAAGVAADPNNEIVVTLAPDFYDGWRANAWRVMAYKAAR
jgi:hypothetical protein